MPPTPAEIQAARAKAHLTQLEAAALIGATRVTFARYEGGTRVMSEALWRLFLHEAGLQRIAFTRRTA